MEPKSNGHHFLTLPRRKHRVQKGLSDVLEVLGLRHSKSFELQQNQGARVVDASSNSGKSISTALPAQPLANQEQPFIKVSSPVTENQREDSVPSNSATYAMPIRDHFRKSRSQATSTRESSAAPSQQTDIPSLTVTKRLPLPLREVSVVSSRTDGTSSTTVRDDISIKTPQTTAPPTRNITPIKSTENQSLFVRDVLSVCQPRLREELKSTSDEGLVDGLSIEDFLSFIASERLRRMPHNGSRWDKILKWAEIFASSLSFFEELTGHFITKSREAVCLIFGSLRVLIQLGPSQAIAIERAFTVFNQFGLIFTFYIRNYTILGSIDKTQGELSLALADTVSLAVEIAIVYHKSVRTLFGHCVAIEFDTSFGKIITAFTERKDHISNLMWTHQLENSDELANLHSSIGDIRSWLLPQDSALRSVGLEKTFISRAEGTCQWFERCLTEFLRSKERILTVSGEVGTGKTVLASWISERLQRPVGRRSYQSIKAHLSEEVPSQATQSALIKLLLLQLLEQNVGNVALYQCLANTLELGNNSNKPEDTEDALWYVLDTALTPCKDVILILDGLDALRSNEYDQLRTIEKLNEITVKHSNIRVIILTQPLAPGITKLSREIVITKARTKEDVKHLTRAYLVSIGLQDESDISNISQQVAERSNGCLTWTQMAFQYFKGLSAEPDISKAVQTVPITVNKIIEDQLTTIPVKGEGRLILSWLLIAHRPLHLPEIKYLLGLNIQKGTYRPRSTNITNDVQRLLGSFIVIRGNTVHFQNETIRRHLVEVSKAGKLLKAPAEAHSDLMTRLLLYTKICVNGTTEPSIEPLENQTIQKIYRSNALLEYVVAYWIKHFTRSSLYIDNHVQTIPSEFKNAIPDSALLAKLEQSAWIRQELLADANEAHILALTIRRAALGDANYSVLQNAITIAKFYEKLCQPDLASGYYSQASNVGQAVLGKVNDLSHTLAIKAVDTAGLVTQETGAEEVTRKEEALKYIIDVEKQKGGVSSSVVTKYSNELAQLYDNTGKNEKAKSVYNDIYQAGIQHHGEFSDEAAAASQRLAAVLYKEGKQGDVVQYQQRLFESAEKSLAIFDVRRVELTLRLAMSHEENKDIVSAEELYISLWRNLGEYAQAHNESSEVHERKIQVTIAYAKFLRNQRRQAEAESLLYGVWIAYEHHDAKSEAVVAQLKLVATELSSLGLLDTAVAVLKNICGWFRSAGKQATADSVDTATVLVETVQKNIAKKHENNVSKAAAAGYVLEEHPEDEQDDEVDTIMEEVAKAVTATTKNVLPANDASTEGQEIPEVSALRLMSSNKLSLFYINKQQYTQSISICQKLLLDLWPALGLGKIGFPQTQRDDAIIFARRLAYSYAESGQSEQAQRVYAQIFYSARSGLQIQDALVAGSATDLISAYEKTKQYNRALVIYQQLLESYRTSLGARHILTIKTLTTLGEFCTKYRFRGAEQYYLQIVNSSKDKEGVISQDSMHAALRLSKIFYDKQRWQEASNLYKSLFVTFTKRGKDYGMSVEVVQTMYTRYVAVMTTLHTQEAIRGFSLEYRNAVLGVYGADTQIAMTANLQLAELYQKSDSPEHHAEAMKITEQVVAAVSKTPAEKQTPQQTSVLASAKRNLATLFSSAPATTTTPEATEKAVTLWTEQLETNKKELGVSHKDTLTALAALIRVNLTSDKPEIQLQAEEQLKSTIVDVLISERDSAKLFNSAGALARIYVSNNLVGQGWAILKSLRYQIISNEISTVDKTIAPLPKTVDRRAFVFIAAFEATLSKFENAEAGFSEIMTDLLTESILFDRYHLSLGQKDLAVHLKIFDGARLYAFLMNKKLHAEQLVFVENVLFELFVKNMGTEIKTSPEVTRFFFVTLLQEMSKHERTEDIATVGGIVGINLVESLLEAEKFAQAYEVATCIYQFIAANKGFSLPQNMGSSFKLSLFLAGLGAKKTSDAQLAAKMVELSTLVLRETLSACKTLQVDLVQLQASDLDNLVRLMGEQKNYTDLEWLLTQLWNSRDLQATWTATTIIGIGRRLVEVVFVHNQDSAITLCESICYNLRRTWGLLDLVTIDMHNLLSSLYATVGRYTDAMRLHEEILQTELSGDIDEQLSEEAASEVMLHQTQLLKKLYARQGGWASAEDDDENSSSGTIPEILNQIIGEFEHDPAWADFVHGRPDAWSSRAPPASDTFGLFVAPTHWEFKHVGENGVKKPDYFPRWLRTNRQLSFGDLALKADVRAKAKNRM